MRVISKGKATGKEYGKIKSKEKLGRIQERKKKINRIENAKKNAERRKEKEENQIEKELISKVEVIDFVKNNFVIKKEEEIEKRVFKLPEGLNKENLHKMKDLIKLKVYGKEVSLREVKVSKDVLKKIAFHIEELI
jgi:5'-3' exonuclease